MYNTALNPQMRIFLKEDALKLRDIMYTLIGYFWCFPDNSEEIITEEPSAQQIIKKYKEGVVLGEEFALCQAPLLFKDEVVILSNGEKGIIRDYAKDELRLGIYTTQGNIYPLSIFDDDLASFSNVDFRVIKVGEISNNNIKWIWGLDEEPYNISMNELKLIWSEPFFVML